MLREYPAECPVKNVRGLVERWRNNLDEFSKRSGEHGKSEKGKKKGKSRQPKKRLQAIVGDSSLAVMRVGEHTVLHQLRRRGRHLDSLACEPAVGYVGSAATCAGVKVVRGHHGQGTHANDQRGFIHKEPGIVIRRSLCHFLVAGGDSEEKE
jgi:hypothetical protein